MLLFFFTLVLGDSFLNNAFQTIRFLEESCCPSNVKLYPEEMTHHKYFMDTSNKLYNYGICLPVTIDKVLFLAREYLNNWITHEIKTKFLLFDRVYNEDEKKLFQSIIWQSKYRDLKSFETKHTIYVHIIRYHDPQNLVSSRRFSKCFN